MNIKATNPWNNKLRYVITTLQSSKTIKLLNYGHKAVQVKNIILVCKMIRVFFTRIWLWCKKNWKRLWTDNVYNQWQLINSMKMKALLNIWIHLGSSFTHTVKWIKSMRFAVQRVRCQWVRCLTLTTKFQMIFMSFKNRSMNKKKWLFRDLSKRYRSFQIRVRGYRMLWVKRRRNMKEQYVVQKRNCLDLI